jgi:hypothetical protein
MLFCLMRAAAAVDIMLRQIIAQWRGWLELSLGYAP